MLYKFSCAYLSSMHLLWWSVQTSCPFYRLYSYYGYLKVLYIYWIKVLCQIFDLQIFFPVWGLSLHSLRSVFQRAVLSVCVCVCVCVFFGHAKQACWILVHQPGIELVPFCSGNIVFFFFFPLNFLFYMGCSWLINNVVIVSEQWRDSPIHIHVSILPQAPLPSRLSHLIEQSSMCYMKHWVLTSGLPGKS